MNTHQFGPSLHIQKLGSQASTFIALKSISKKKSHFTRLATTGTESGGPLKNLSSKILKPSRDPKRFTRSTSQPCENDMQMFVHIEIFIIKWSSMFIYLS